jgi:hypothetical protein
MSSNLHTYRVTDPTLAAEIQEIKAAWRAYMGPGGPVAEYQRNHPGNDLYASIGLETTFEGFANGAATVPEGLSYRRGRDYLLPMRGVAGKPWRDVLDRFNRGVPNISEFLSDRKIPSYVLDADRSMLCHLSIQDYGDHGVFLTIGTALRLSNDRLALVPLSEFYAAKEAFESTRAVTSGAAS